MQTLQEIRELLDAAGFVPQKRFGQNFLIDLNSMRKLLELAELPPETAVLEVGPGTGSLTEELLDRAARVVAVEIDRGFCELLRRRFAQRDNLTLVCADALSGKHALEDALLAALPERAHLVANLPYQIATPLLAECLLSSWRATTGREGGGTDERVFERMTFTVQRELADRLTASQGDPEYGPVSIIVASLARVQLGPILPPTAFWPRPQVQSRIVRIDFDEPLARELHSAHALTSVLHWCFTHRRKQIGWLLHAKRSPVAPEALRSGLDAAAIDPASRPEEITPAQFRTLANAMADHLPGTNAQERGGEETAR